jgi:pseudaminic acid cytidylyltransferase
MRVALIPAKGGSIRIPGKNIRSFFGKPIIGYSIETAIASGLFDRICVSSDNQEVAEVARSFGAEVLMRPETLAQVGTQEVAKYALEQLSTKEAIPRHACVIYATSPLLTVEDLKSGWNAMHAHLSVLRHERRHRAPA